MGRRRETVISAYSMVGYKSDWTSKDVE